MYTNMEQFSNAYDDLVVKGHIIDEGINKTMGDKGTVTNVEILMNALKVEVSHEANGITDPLMKAPANVQPVQQNSNEASNDFYQNLKNL